MINILILAAGNNTSFESYDGGNPIILTEFNGKMLIEHLVSACKTLGKARIIFALRENDVHKHHLNDIIGQLAPSAKIVQITGTPQGAACSSLLAAEYIDNDNELLILNGNEFLEADFGAVRDTFHKTKLDAGVVTFSSMHPRYSYVKVSDDGLVHQAAEKDPISRHATVGFYWFARGKDFVEAAKDSVRKDARVGGNFYICPVFNEMILKKARIGNYPVNDSCYYPLKTEQQLQKFGMSATPELRKTV